MANTNTLALIKKAIPLLSVAGIDIDKILQESLVFLPQFFLDQMKKFKDQDPDLNVVCMIVNRKDEIDGDQVWLVPVGVDGVEIKKQYEPLNLNEFISKIEISKILADQDNTGDNLGENNVSE
jgi:hypothetical protein